MSESLTRLSQLCETYSILYVEDDANTQEEVARTLRRIFRVVHLGQNGAHGLTLFKQHSPTIVITDIQMPEKNGLDMAKEIKALSPQTPIIITTAFNDELFFIKAIEASIDAFLLKPIDKEKLYDALLKVVTHLRYLEQAKEREHLKMIDKINHASEASIKNLADVFPFPALFYQKGTLVFVNTTASTTLSSLQIKDYESEDTFIRTFGLSANTKQKIKLPTSQGLHKIFWVYPNSLRMGNDESVIQAYIFVDITLLEYHKLKLSNYALFMHQGPRHTKEASFVDTDILSCPPPKAQSSQKTASTDTILHADDKEILRKTYHHAISAKDYIEEIGDDCSHELEELNDAKDELKNLLYLLQERREEALLIPIAGIMLRYAIAMEALFEFKDLGYALRSISRLLSDLDAETKAYDIGKLVVFLNSIADDLSTWYHTIFIHQDTQNIHYLDSSLLSSCLQMEATFTGAYEDSLGDDLELF